MEESESERKDMTKLYWTGCPAQIRLFHAESIPEVDSKAAVRILRLHHEGMELGPMDYVGTS